MPAVYSELLAQMCDSYSDEWRHECECRWLLNEKSNLVQLNLFLYGVENRSKVVITDASGQDQLIPGHARLWQDPDTKPLIAYRGLQAAERLLNDVLKLKKLRALG